MATPLSVPPNAYFIPVNLSSGFKTFTLPVVSTNPGRVIVFKDAFGNAVNSSLRLSTLGLDRIERSTVSSIVLSNAFGAWTFMNDGFTTWFLTDAYLNNLFLVQPTPPVPPTLLTAGNATANMSITGLTIMSGVTGVDDTGAYLPVGFTFNFFNVNYSNASNAPGVYWNTNNVLGFGTARGDIGWSVTNPGILLGNADRRTNTFYYSPTSNFSGHQYINCVYQGQNNYADGQPNVIRWQMRLFRGPTNQYVEVRIQGFGATQGTWNITNGSAYQNTFSGYSASAGTSFVLVSDLNGANWVLCNAFYMNAP